MPPKNAPKKAGEEVDMSDISALPWAYVCLFQVKFSKFKDVSVRQRITDHVTKNFPEERVQNLTRQNILDYAKSKGITEAEEDGGPEVMLGHAAADKIFEMTVTARGSKKQKQIKQQEEANEATPEGQTPPKIETDGDIVDLLINMPDYPASDKEAWGLSRYSQNVNCHYEIYQVQETEESTVPENLNVAPEVATEDEAELEQQASVSANVDQLKYAQSHSAPGAPVRNMAFFRVPFCDVELVPMQQNEDGDEATNTLTSEQTFMKGMLVDHIEKNAAYQMNFNKFLAQVDVHQLMPEKETMDEIKRLRQAHSLFLDSKVDQEATIEEIKGQVLTDGQKEGMTPEQIEEFEAQRVENIKAVEEQLLSQINDDKQGQSRVKELLVLAKRSIDDEREPGHFKDNLYKSDFIQDNQIQNTVPSILSALVNQISVENSGNDQFSEGMEDTTEAETLDDLFQSYNQEIQKDNNLIEREEPEGNFGDFKLKGVLPPHVDVYDTLDTSIAPIISLPASMVEDNKLKAKQIGDREKSACQNLQLPGKDRYMMPPCPSKSKRLRDFENPQFYPFSTLPIEDAERTMQLKTLQKLIKSDKIDDGATPKERLGKNKVFERKFDQYFNSELMPLILSEALRNDPDVSSSYYQRSDQLLLILHNKINNSKRAADNLDKPHGVKAWKTEYRVLPTFQNWISFFQGSIKQQLDYLPKETNDPPVKYTMDQEAIPKVMLSIDNIKVQNVEQTVNQFFPDDNSILNSETYSIGGIPYKKSQVYKDQYAFGIQNVTEDSYLKVQEQTGLASYTQVGEHQVWLNFSDHESKMLIETVRAQRNKRKQIEIQAAGPTAAEIAAKEDAARVAAAAKPGKGKAGAPAEVVEETKEVEVAFEEEEPNFLDHLFTDQELSEETTGACINVTMKNGLIVRHMPNGDIVQIQDSSLTNRSSHTEIDRVFLAGGIVVKHFSNLDSQVLYPQGDVAFFSREEMKWTVTNGQGFKRVYKDGVYSMLPRINCLSQTDSKTGIVTKVREDNVVYINYPDGNLYCQHADGTQIFCQKDGQQIRIEKDGFAPVMYQSTQNGEDTEEWLETDELRSLDGMMTYVYLPDGCIVKSIRYWKTSEQKDIEVTKHIYQRADYSCVIVDNDGDFRIISTNARAAINDEDERARLGNDTDYLKQMYKPAGEYTPNVFYGHVSEDPERVHITCKDFDKPFRYAINHRNDLQKFKIEEWERDTQWENKLANHTFEAEKEIELIGQQKNPFTKNFIYPRMFVLNPSGDGIELLTQEQVDLVIKNSQYKDNVLTTSRVEYVDNTMLNSIQVMNKVTTLQEKQINNCKMNKLEFPEYALPYIIHKKSEEELNKQKPIQDLYHVTNISEYNNFEPLKQNSFLEDHGRFQDWKTSQLRYETEFGLIHIPPKDGVLDMDEIEDNEYYALRILTKVYKERALMKPEFDRGSLKENFVKAYHTDDDVVDFRKNMTTVAREEKEIKIEQEKRDVDAEKNKDVKQEQELEKSKEVERKEKKERTKKRVNIRLQEYKDKKDTQMFASLYHQSRSGIDYYIENPVKPPSEEVLLRMTQRINRSQANEGDKEAAFDESLQKNEVHEEEKAQEDNPIVALEPEEQLNQASMDKSRKYKSMSQEQDLEQTTQNDKSLFAQEKTYLKVLEQESILKAEEHHVIKTKDFNVYGKLRTEKPFVKATQKSTVQSELNEKFITTECITDRRVKISSMANRQYINAPAVEEVRKQGQHQMIQQAISKKQTFSELINQANSMVTSVLHDSLKRSVNILPSCCKFGLLQRGSENEMIVTIKNEDSLSSRIQIKPTQDHRIIVRQETYGPIAPGMFKTIIITIRLTQDNGESSKIKEDIIIMTKSDHFKLPVEATVIDEDQYEQQEQELLTSTGKHLGNSRVKNRLRESIEMSQKKLGVMDKFRKEVMDKEDMDGMDMDGYNDAKYDQMEGASQNM